MLVGESLNANSFDAVAKSIHRSTVAACSGVAKLKAPGALEMTSARRGMFNALASTKGYKKLTSVLYQLGEEPIPGGGKVSGAIPAYVGSRWYSLMTLICAIVICVLAVVMACSIFSCAQRCCCRHEVLSEDGDNDDDSSKESSARNRQMRSTLVQIGHRIRVGLFILSTLCFVTFAILVGFGIKSMVDITNSTDVINCNMWMELDGYFNGAQNAKPDNLPSSWLNDYESGSDSSSSLTKFLSGSMAPGDSVDGKTLLSLITNNWLGSQHIKAGLAELNDLTSPENNPVYKNFTEGRKALQVDTEYHQNNINTNLTLATTIADDYAKFTELIKPYLADKKLQPIGNWDKNAYDIKFALQTVFNVKADLFKNELASAISQSWTTIDELIEKYAGATSELMSNANTAVRHTLQTILQIDQAMSNMYDVWNSKGGLLTALAVSEIVLGAVYCICGLVAGGLTVCLSVSLIRKSAQNRRPLKRYGRCTWRSAFVICCGGIALSALTTGITFFAATAGSDACQVADTGLLTNGDWTVLGRKILHPETHFDDTVQSSAKSVPTVDMRQVLDVCLKRDGDGSIGARLGIDAAIGEVNQNVEDAIDDIRDTRERLLLRKSRIMRIRIIGFIMHELLRGWTHNSHYGAGGLLGVPVSHNFNEYQQINWENHTKADQGRRVMLGFTPMWPDALSITTKGLFYGISSIPDAYTYLNSISDAAHAANPSTTLPRFCGPLAKKRKLACAYFDADDKRPVIDLGDTSLTLEMIDGWVGFKDNKYALDTDLPRFDRYENHIGERTRHLIGALRFVERAGSVTTKELNWKTDDPRCADKECTFDDLREMDAQHLGDTVWPTILEEYENLVKRVDAYVDGQVVPSTQSMVNKANDLMSNTNCQFQRGVIDYAVVTPLCTVTFPATTELSLISFLAFVVLTLLGILLWAYKPIFTKTAAIASSPDRKSVV